MRSSRDVSRALLYAAAYASDEMMSNPNPLFHKAQAGCRSGRGKLREEQGQPDGGRSQVSRNRLHDTAQFREELVSARDSPMMACVESRNPSARVVDTRAEG